MGKCQNDVDSIHVENVEAGEIEKFAMHFDFAEVGTSCQYIYRVVLGAEGDSQAINAYMAQHAAVKPGIGSGSCAGGVADIIRVNGDGSVASVMPNRWVQVTRRDPKVSMPGELQIPVVLSHHKSADAMPVPYREDIAELRKQDGCSSEAIRSLKFPF